METLEGLAMRQGADTADLYLRRAVASIDDVLGEGYAAKHPELIAVFMQVAHADADGMVRHSGRQAKLAAAWEREP